jgi:hypothetical protein
MRAWFCSKLEYYLHFAFEKVDKVNLETKDGEKDRDPLSFKHN